MRKHDFCLCENKDADQLRSNCEADQRLCFRYSDSTIPLLLKSKISSSSSFLSLYRPVCVGPGRKPRRPVFSRRGSFKQIRFSGKSRSSGEELHHYENMPMQYTEIFTVVKNENFQ